MQSVEAEGTTIDEAIANALELLDVERDRVEIEIMSDATRGLFGLGGKKARVRATVRAPLMGADGPAVAERPAEGERRRGRQAAAPGGQTRLARPSQRPARSPAPAPASNEDGVGPEVERQGAHGEPRETLPVSKEAADRGAELLRTTLELMGMQATVEVETGAEPYDEVVLQITGDSSGVVIGRHGQTVDAIEYIVNRLVAREFQSVGHIVVDAAGYRSRRRQSLTEMARRLADKAKRERRTVTLNPLSPRDRRVVHIALQGDRSITTRSHGAGLHRKLLIIPGGAVRRQRTEALGER